MKIKDSERLLASHAALIKALEYAANCSQPFDWKNYFTKAGALETLGRIHKDAFDALRDARKVRTEIGRPLP